MQLKSGVGILDNNGKVRPHTGYEVNLQSGATGKKIFTSIERKFLKLWLLNGRTEYF
jgi:hypothetical protein